MRCNKIGQQIIFQLAMLEFSLGGGWWGGGGMEDRKLSEMSS